MKLLQKQIKKMRKKRLCWNLIPTKYSKLSESYHVLFMADVGGQYKRQSLVRCPRNLATWT